jgi:hypothetical protein
MGYNTLYLIGILLSFAVGFAGLWISIRNSRRTGYINSITSARIKYIQDIRNAVSEFCGLVYNYRFLAGEVKVYNYPSDIKESRERELSEIRKRIGYLKYLIQLYLNVEDKYFDPKIILLLDEINLLSDKNAEPKICLFEILTLHLPTPISTSIA